MLYFDTAAVTVVKCFIHYPRVLLCAVPIHLLLSVQSCYLAGLSELRAGCTTPESGKTIIFRTNANTIFFGQKPAAKIFFGVY